MILVQKRSVQQSIPVVHSMFIPINGMCIPKSGWLNCGFQCYHPGFQSERFQNVHAQTDKYLEHIKYRSIRVSGWTGRVVIDGLVQLSQGKCCLFVELQWRRSQLCSYDIFMALRSQQRFQKRVYTTFQTNVSRTDMVLYTDNATFMNISVFKIIRFQLKFSARGL